MLTYFGKLVNEFFGKIAAKNTLKDIPTVSEKMHFYNSQLQQYQIKIVVKNALQIIIKTC